MKRLVRLGEGLLKVPTGPLDFKAQVPMGYLEPLLWNNDDKNVTLVVDKDKAARHCFHLPSALRFVEGYGKIKTSFFRPGVDWA